MKATDIAEAFGYKDFQYFSRSFRKRFDIGASERRQRPEGSDYSSLQVRACAEPGKKTVRKQRRDVI